MSDFGPDFGPDWGPDETGYYTSNFLNQLLVDFGVGTPNPNTAYILESLIIALQNVIQSEVDISLSTEEFALGQPLSARPIDLCFGLDPLFGTVPSEDLPGALSAEIILSRGIARDSALGLVNINSQVFTPSAGLPNTPLENSYIFGSLFLESGGVVNSYLTFGAGNAQDVFVVNQDLSTDEMTTLLQSGLTPSGVSTGVNPVEIIRFIIVIDKYDPTVTPVVRETSALVWDMRRIRGWGGFCEETMFSILAPPIINVVFQTSLEYSTLSLAVTNLVTKWVNLNWQPSFSVYWTNGVFLPPNLASFIQTKLGITV